MNIPEEVKQLISEIRRDGTLKNPGIVKYDFYKKGDDLTGPFIFFLIAVLLKGASFLRGDKHDIFINIFCGILIIFSILSLWGWFKSRRGKYFLLLTPKYLISVEGPIEFFEWQYMSGLYIYAEANIENRKIKVDWPIDRPITIPVFLPHEKAAIGAGNRKIMFLYKTKKMSMDIPTCVDIQNIAKFINLYWTSVNPEAKKKRSVST